MDAHREQRDTAGAPLAARWAQRPSPIRSRGVADALGTWSVGLDPSSDAPGLARRALAPLVEQLEHESRENIRLLATELVTNAVMHAGEPPGPILVDAHLFADLAVVSVSDEGAGFDPALLRGSAPGVPGGRGLELVVLLADGLGIDSRTPFRVWFAICR